MAPYLTVLASAWFATLCCAVGRSREGIETAITLAIGATAATVALAAWQFAVT